MSCVHCRQKSALLEHVWTASITVATIQAAGTPTSSHQTIVLLVSWDNPLNWLITSNSIMKCGSSVKSSRLHLGISIDNCHLQNDAPGLIEMSAHRNLYFINLKIIINITWTSKPFSRVLFIKAVPINCMYCNVHAWRMWYSYFVSFLNETYNFYLPRNAVPLELLFIGIDVFWEHIWGVQSTRDISAVNHNFEKTKFKVQ